MIIQYLLFLLIPLLRLAKSSPLTTEETEATGIHAQKDYSTSALPITVQTICDDFFKPEYKGKKLILSGWVKTREALGPRLIRGELANDHNDIYKFLVKSSNYFSLCNKAQDIWVSPVNYMNQADSQCFEYQASRWYYIGVEFLIENTSSCSLLFKESFTSIDAFTIPFVKVPNAHYSETNNTISEAFTRNYTSYWNSAVGSTFSNPQPDVPSNSQILRVAHAPTFGGTSANSMPLCLKSNTKLYTAEESVGFIKTTGDIVKDPNFRFTLAADAAHKFEIKQEHRVPLPPGGNIVSKFEGFTATVAVYDNDPNKRFNRELLFGLSAGNPTELEKVDFRGFSTTNPSPSLTSINPYWDNALNRFRQFLLSPYQILSRIPLAAPNDKLFRWGQLMQRRVGDKGFSLFIDERRLKWYDNFPGMKPDDSRCHSMSLSYSFTVKSADDNSGFIWGYKTGTMSPRASDPACIEVKLRLGNFEFPIPTYYEKKNFDFQICIEPINSTNIAVNLREKDKNPEYRNVTDIMMWRLTFMRHYLSLSGQSEDINFNSIFEETNPTDRNSSILVEHMMFDFATEFTICHYNERVNFVATTNYQIVMDRVNNPGFSYKGFNKHRENIIINKEYFTTASTNQYIDISINHISRFVNYPSPIAPLYLPISPSSFTLAGGGRSLALEYASRLNYVDLKLSIMNLYKGGLNMIWYVRPEATAAADAKLGDDGYEPFIEPTSTDPAVTTEGFLPSLMKNGQMLPRNGISRVKIASCQKGFTLSVAAAGASDSCVSIAETSRIKGCLFQDGNFCEVCDSSGGFEAIATPQKDGSVKFFKTLYFDTPNRVGSPMYNQSLDCIKMGIRQPVLNKEPEVFNNYTMGSLECQNDQPFPGYPNLLLRQIRYDMKTCFICDNRVLPDFTSNQPLLITNFMGPSDINANNRTLSCPCHISQHVLGTITDGNGTRGGCLCRMRPLCKYLYSLNCKFNCFQGLICINDINFSFKPIQNWTDTDIDILNLDAIQRLKYFQNSHFDCRRCKPGYYSAKQEDIFGSKNGSTDTELIIPGTHPSDLNYYCISKEFINGYFFYRRYIASPGPGPRPQFLLAMGIDLLTDNKFDNPQLKRCVVKGCINCDLDYEDCWECQTQVFDLSTSTYDNYILYKYIDTEGVRKYECKKDVTDFITYNPLFPLLKKYLGLNELSFAVEYKPCEDSNCIDCAANYLHCDDCRGNNTFYTKAKDPITGFEYCREKTLDATVNPVSMLSPDSGFTVIEKSFISTREVVRLQFSAPLNSLINFESIKITCYEKDLETVVSTKFKKGELKELGQVLLLYLDFTQNVENGLIEVKFLNTNDLFEEGKPEKRIEEDSYVVNKVSIFKVTNEAALTTAASAAGSSLQILAIIYFILNTSKGLVLMKLFQMVDFFLFYNVDVPRNANYFFQYLGKSPIANVPNFLEFMSDDKCKVVKSRLANEGFSCQIFKNYGNYIFVTFLLVVFKLIISGLYHILDFFKKDPLWLRKLQFKLLTSKFWFAFYDAIQLDLFLNSFIAMLSYEGGSLVSQFNLAFSVIYFAFAILGQVWVWSKIRFYQQMTIKNQINEEKIKKLIEMRIYSLDILWVKLEYKSDHWIQRYHLMVNYLRDPIMAACMVFLHDYPTIQILSIGSIFAAQLFVSLKFKPFKSKYDNIKLNSANISYCFIKVLYLVLILGNNSITEKNKTLMIGNLMILSVCSLFLIEVLVGGYVSWIEFREKRALNKKMKEEKEQAAKKIPEKEEQEIDSSGDEDLGDLSIDNGLMEEEAVSPEILKKENLLDEDAEVDEQAEKLSNRPKPEVKINLNPRTGKRQITIQMKRKPPLPNTAVKEDKWGDLEEGEGIV